jgi:hypothetical protein
MANNFLIKKYNEDYSLDYAAAEFKNGISTKS